jgi:tRNA nucleotidyltransferase (CCA-adding enzyme)
MMMNASIDNRDTYVDWTEVMLEAGELPLEPTTPIDILLEWLDSLNTDVLPEALLLLLKPLPLLVLSADLYRMQLMGLGTIPVEAIALPVSQEWLANQPTVGIITNQHHTIIALQQHPFSFMTNPQQQVLDVKNRLSQCFSTPFMVALYELQSILNRLNVRGYVIGGLARDLMLFAEQRTLQIRDIDMTLEGNAHEIAHAIIAHSKNFTLLDTHPTFGTAKLLYKQTTQIDLASTRRESYAYCGALPTLIERGVPLAQDVQRRDFTVNTLALAIHNLGELFDFTQGIQHLEQKQIQVLHGATFFEDPSRVFRAFKFANRLGFHLSEQTQQLMQQFFHYVPLTKFKGGGARVKDSLREWFAQLPSQAKHQGIISWLKWGGMVSVLCQENNPALTQRNSVVLDDAQRMSLSETLEIFRTNWLLVQPLLEQLPESTRAVFICEKETGYGLSLEETLLWLCTTCYWLASFVEEPNLVQALANRLELTKFERETVQDYFRFLTEHPLDNLHPEGSALEMTQAFDNHNPASLVALIMANRQAKQWMEPLIKYLKVWRTLKPELDGDDLLALGIPRGEAVGKLLRRLRAAYLTKQIQNKEEEIIFVQVYLANLGVANDANTPVVAEGLNVIALRQRFDKWS